MKLFRRMKEFAGNHSVFISILLSLIVTTIFMGVNEGGIMDDGHLLVFKGLILFIVLFMSMFSIISFEEMTKRYNNTIYKQEEEISFLKDLLLERREDK